MSFLREQLGEEELAAMMDQLKAEGADSPGVDVAKLMEIALNAEEVDEDKD